MLSSENWDSFSMVAASRLMMAIKMLEAAKRSCSASGKEAESTIRISQMLVLIWRVFV